MEYRSQVLGIFNQKGGVGKTTVAAVIAEYAAVVKGLSVLIVDLDMQCNSSDYWVGMESAPNEPGGQLPPRHPDHNGDPNTNERSTIADIFYGLGVMPYETFITRDKGFSGYVDIMLGHPRLLEEVCTAYDNASGKISTQIIDQVGKFLHLPDVAESYDLIILDTGPTRNPVFRAALRAATHALIPFELEEKSKQGINAMVQVINNEAYLRDSNGRGLEMLGFLPNKVRGNTNLHKASLSELHEGLAQLMCPEDIYLPLSTAYPERDIKGISPKSIFSIAKDHKARVHAEQVGEFVLSRVFPGGTPPAKSS